MIKWWRSGNDQRRKEIEAEIRLLHEDGLLEAGEVAQSVKKAIDENLLLPLLLLPYGYK